VSEIPKYVFCPRCHKRINTPKFVGQITIAVGFFTVSCVDEKCSGKVEVVTDRDAYKKHKAEKKVVNNGS